MQISTRFSIAIHVLSCLMVFKDKFKLTSDFLAKSTNVNPVIIRKILGQLKNAEIIKINRGSGGASIIKPLNEITLLDVYKATECVEHGKLFDFHENPNALCPIGKNIHKVIDNKLLRAQEALENELSKVTLANLKEDFSKIIDDK